MRDYQYMRNLMLFIGRSNKTLLFNDFKTLEPRNQLQVELLRLQKEGIIQGEVAFDNMGVCETCNIDGLTDEGKEFYKLIENDEVWAIILQTLRKADIDISYPLLKEVCEEIVKRYVMSFIDTK